MNILSVVVRTRPVHLQQIERQLAELPGVEIHATTPEGRLVITVEDASSSSAAESLLKVQNLDRVLAASLVYQYSDEFDQQEA